MASVLQKLLCNIGHNPTPITEDDFKAYLVTKGMLRIKVGTYTGDAAATKAVTGVGFQPSLLLIYGQVDANNLAVKTSQDTTGAFIVIEAHTHYLVDQIISLDADGFTVGDGTGSADYMNLAQAYVYVALG